MAVEACPGFFDGGFPVFIGAGPVDDRRSWRGCCLVSGDQHDGGFAACGSSVRGAGLPAQSALQTGQVSAGWCMTRRGGSCAPRPCSRGCSHNGTVTGVRDREHGDHSPSLLPRGGRRTVAVRYKLADGLMAGDRCENRSTRQEKPDSGSAAARIGWSTLPGMGRTVALATSPLDRLAIANARCELRRAGLGM